MVEFQKINHLVEAENKEEATLNLKEFSIERSLKLKTENFSENFFLEETDNVVLYGRNRIKSEQNIKGSNNEYKFYSSGDVELSSFLGNEILREKDGTLELSRNIYFCDKDNILYLDNHVVGIPKESQVYFYPLFVMIQLAGKRLILFWSDKKFNIESKEYVLSNNTVSNVFIDKSGNVAINYLDMIATFMFEERRLDVNGYKIQLEEKKQRVKLNKKWIELGSELEFNGEEGVVRYNYSYLKFPPKSGLIFNKDELTAKVGADKEIRFLAQVDRLVFVDEKYWIVFDQNSRIVIDKNADVVFLHQENIVSLNKEAGVIKLSGFKILIQEGAIVRVAKNAIHLNEAVKASLNDRRISILKNSFIFAGKVEVSVDKNEVIFKTKEKQIRVIPYKKQIFMNIGGKLVIITVSIGVAVDGNGNIAFDYQNKLTTIAATSFVMNLHDVVFFMGAVDDFLKGFINNVMSADSGKQIALDQIKEILSQLLGEFLISFNIQEIMDKLIFISGNKQIEETNGSDLSQGLDILIPILESLMMADSELLTDINNINSLLPGFLNSKSFPA